MEMYVKKDGSVKKIYREEKKISLEYYMTKEENCFKNIINQNNVEKSLNNLSSIKNLVFGIINRIQSSDMTIIDNAYDMIKNTKSKEHLEKTINYLVNEYKIITDNSSKLPYRAKFTSKKSKQDFINYSEKYFDLIASIMVKKIVTLHFKKLLLSFETEKINELESLKSSGVSINILLENINEKLSDNSMVNKFIKNVYSDTIDSVYDGQKKHLCWENCKNASPLLCPKIKDSIKKNIEDYPFITEGYQLYNENGNTDVLFVSECENYCYAKDKSLTDSDLKKIIKAKEALREIYFDAASLEEAGNIQDYLLKTGQIYNARGKRIAKKR